MILQKRSKRKAMIMTKALNKANELYHLIDNQEKVTLDFLYDAICYFETDPEEVVEILNKISEEESVRLKEAFSETRKTVKTILEETLSAGTFGEAFHDPEVEDILFYQMAHGYDIG